MLILGRSRSKIGIFVLCRATDNSRLRSFASPPNWVLLSCVKLRGSGTAGRTPRGMPSSQPCSSVWSANYEVGGKGCTHYLNYRRPDCSSSIFDGAFRATCHFSGSAGSSSRAIACTSGAGRSHSREGRGGQSAKRGTSERGTEAGAGDSGAWLLGRSLHWTHVGREGQRQSGNLAHGSELLPQPALSRVP